MLGHHLGFSYCRTMNESLPCSKILDCWFETFAVQEFIEQNYTEEERQKIFAPPKPKITSLLEAIEKAKNR